MKKRAEFSEVARMVLVIVFAILVIASVSVFIIFIREEADRSACTQSIIKSGFDNEPNLDCEAERLTISIASLEKDAGGQLDEEGLDDALKMKIANEMYACWKMTGKGMIDPYTTSEGFPVLICEIVKFKNLRSFSGLLKWMSLNKPQGGDEPYFDTFYGKPTEEVLENLEYVVDTYDTSREYAVVWWHVPNANYDPILFVPYEEIANRDKIWSWDVVNLLPAIINYGLTGVLPIVMN